MQFNNLAQIAMQENQLQQTTIDRINDSYAQFRKCYGTMQDIQIEGANFAREVGLLLIEFKHKCPYGEFTQSFATFHGRVVTDYKFEFSYDYGALMMRIAARYSDVFTKDNFPERVRSLHDLLYVSNQLQLPAGHGEQTLHQPNFLSFVAKSLTNFKAEWQKQLSRRPIEDWDQPELEQFIGQFEPIVEDVNSIYAKVKARIGA